MLNEKENIAMIIGEDNPLIIYLTFILFVHVEFLFLLVYSQMGMNHRITLKFRAH